jgi:hypothetical protein
MSVFVSTSPTNPPTQNTFNLGWYDPNHVFINNAFYSLYATQNSDFSNLVLVGFTNSPALVVDPSGHVLIFLNISLNNGVYYLRVVGTGLDTYSQNYGLTLEVTCYVEGTKILCNVNGIDEYIKIENLCNGVKVKTHLDGYKSITNIGKFKFKNSQSIVNSIYKLEKGKLGANEDLFVSGNHSVIVDDLTEEEKKIDLMARGISNKFENGYLNLAFMNKNFTKVEDDKYYTLYHLVLENEDSQKHYGIYANGVLSESMSKHWFEKTNMIDNEIYNKLKTETNKVLLNGELLQIM